METRIKRVELSLNGEEYEVIIQALKEYRTIMNTLIKSSSAPNKDELEHYTSTVELIDSMLK